VDIRIPSPAHERVAGRALLAQLRENQLKQALTRATSPDTETSDEDYRQGVDATIRQIQAEGYSIDEDAREPGMRCYSVPIPGAGRPYVISVAGPIERLGQDRGSGAITVLRQAAQMITEGFTSAWPQET